jgi:hypothetical protein
MELRNKKIDFVRSMIGGIVCLVIGFWFWYSLAGNPFDEYALIRSGIIGNGFITKIDEYEDAAEEAEREKIVPKYSYQYEFRTQDRRLIKSFGDEGGHIPDSLRYVNTIPFPIHVEYLSKHPDVNRIIGMHVGCTSIGEWLWRKVALGGVLLVICLSIGFEVIRRSLKGYSVK